MNTLKNAEFLLQIKYQAKNKSQDKIVKPRMENELELYFLTPSKRGNIYTHIYTNKSKRFFFLKMGSHHYFRCCFLQNSVFELAVQVCTSANQQFLHFCFQKNDMNSDKHK